MNISQAAAIMGAKGGASGTGEAKARRSELCRKAQRIGQIAMRSSDKEKLYMRCNRLHPSGCWVWTCSMTEKGYGKLMINGKPWRAHRFSWHVHRGPIPEGMLVLHKCDNPPCCNPEHLFLGTDMDNQHDCIAKGRFAKGIRMTTAKLNDDIVREIRTEAKRHGFTQAAASRRFGVSPSLIGAVIRGKKWAHVV